MEKIIKKIVNLIDEIRLKLLKNEKFVAKNQYYVIGVIIGRNAPSGGQQSLFAFIKMNKLNKDQVRAIKNAAELDGLSMADRKTLIKMIDDLMDKIKQSSYL